MTWFVVVCIGLLAYLLGYLTRAWEQWSLERIRDRQAKRLLAEMLAAPGVKDIDPRRPADGCDVADHDLGVHSPWHIPAQRQAGDHR